MIRCLLFISLIGGFCSCQRKLVIPPEYTIQSKPLEKAMESLIDVEYDSLKSYNTTVESYGKYFSGVTYFKNVKDSSLRVLFTTHTGMKLLDLELVNNSCNTKYVMEQMNNEIVLKLLCHDFTLLTQGVSDVIKPTEILSAQDGSSLILVKGDKDIYYYLTSTGKTDRVVETIAGKRKIQTVFTKQASDSSLIVKHYNFNFKMNFKNAK